MNDIFTCSQCVYVRTVHEHLVSMSVPDLSPEKPLGQLISYFETAINSADSM